jgi:hypothetical protein
MLPRSGSQTELLFRYIANWQSGREKKSSMSSSAHSKLQIKSYAT